jgi:hypothetical protein
VHLVIVDGLAAVRQPTADLQRSVDDGAQRRQDDGGLVRHAGIEHPGTDEDQHPFH